MPPERSTVFLPCHTLDDFPTWLEEAEAEDLLAAWTAAWHPAIVAAVGAVPRWASVDLPVPAGPLLGIVPSTWDDRFAAQFEAACTVGSAFVRRVVGVEAIARAAADRLGLPDGPLAAGSWADDFQALGLASLVAELLARRMRTHADLDSTGFEEAVVSAARAAVAGRDDEARDLLQRGYDAVSSTRARYYPVDSYVVDLVLLADTTRGDAVEAASASPVPVAVAATAATARTIAAAFPAAAAALREGIAAGRVELCGGRDADTRLDMLTPEAALASFAAGLDTYRETLGSPPASFARRTGGAATLLPQLIAGHGLEGGVWSLFDGGPLPDVGGGMIRWQAGGAAVDLLAAVPLDAGSARSVLALHETLGDALDRDHVAAVLFAHFAGRASRWHGLLRRIGRGTNLLGTFVTPRELARRAAGAGTPVSFEPDAFPPTLPKSPDGADAAAISACVANTARDAAAILAAAAPFMVSPAAAPASTAPPPAPQRRWLSFGLPARGGDAEQLALDNGLVRVEVHRHTGGLLSVRRDRDAANRLSQQLAIRTTRPAADRGGSWDRAEDLALHTRMVADDVRREAGAGGDAVVSRGRLVAADGGVAARFTQRVALVAGLPIAALDIAVDVERPLAGPLLEHHVAARFAWHENEHVEIRRSVLMQSVATERTRFTAPHFVEIVPEGTRTGAEAGTVTILTAGLPWHLLSTPHVLDSLLAGAADSTVRRRLAVGLGLPRPWDAALAVAAGGPLGARVPGLPDNVRLTVRDVVVADGRLVSARVGLLESAGRAGAVTVDWGRPVERATAVDFLGGAREEPAVAIEGGRTVVSLARHQWLQLDVGFAG